MNPLHYVIVWEHGLIAFAFADRFPATNAPVVTIDGAYLTRSRGTGESWWPEWTWRIETIHTILDEFAVNHGDR